MTSCLVLTTPAPDVPALSADLEDVGIHVLGAVQRSNLVQEALRLAPDLVICHDPSPDAALFDTAALLAATSPRPVLLFTTDPDAEKIARALDCGIHAYVVNGYSPQRLRPLAHLAQARFAHEQRLREQLADVSSRFEERKLVDRAKGILMRARQVSEEEAFRVLRAASMQSNQRVGQVSQQVIAAAGSAEAVNRAGQLRMLSQRIVKLHAMQAIAPSAAPQPALQESCARLDANLAALAKSLSKATYGDLLDAVALPWEQLKTALGDSAATARLGEVDALAERMLVLADRLVNTLEATGTATRLHVINVSGRQRMLSQRVAKQALLASLLRADAAAAAAAKAEGDKARAEFEQALAHLNAVPLSSRDIRESLDQAQRLWAELTGSLGKVRTAEGQRTLGESSESLLMLFEQLTDRYERSMQMLMG